MYEQEAFLPNHFREYKIANEDYLRSLVIYIHLNPQHHGFVSDFKTYSHSSYPAFLSSLSTSLMREDVISLFDDLDNFTYCHQNKSKFLDGMDAELLLE